MEIDLENCETLKLPKPAIFWADPPLPEKAKALVNLAVASLLVKVALPDKVRGDWWDYNQAAANARLKVADITHITYNDLYIRTPWEGDGETNLAQGAVFDDDTNFIYIAMGDKKVLLEAIEEETIAEDERDRELFKEAIENIGKPEESEGAKTIVHSYGISPDEAIAYILAEHFSRVDKPKGGWQAEGGNPYKKILREMEE